MTTELAFLNGQPTTPDQPTTPKPMPSLGAAGFLDPPFDPERDHYIGEPDAPAVVVEYGSYACLHCRAADERISDLRDEFGEALLYVFRHRPLTGNALARRAAELVEMTQDHNAFWQAHETLMHRSSALSESDLELVADQLGVELDTPVPQRARDRVRDDEASALASGVRISPTFFVDGRRYDGAWDSSAFADAVRGRLGYRLNAAAVDFLRWGPAAGLLLLLSSVLAVVLINSPIGDGFATIWAKNLSVTLGDRTFGMPVVRWVSDGLLTIFFLAVGLEIKREFTIGHLADRKSAALPVGAALGGMIVPAMVYLAVTGTGAWSNGWGIPIATDTAFAVALIVALGRRVPVELRVFLTAAAIVDDIVIILIVAVFYSHGLDVGYLGAAAVTTGALALLNRGRIYRVLPYAILGGALWMFLFLGGVHATLAGVLLALAMPTRPPPNVRGLMMQAGAVADAEGLRSAGGTSDKSGLRHRLSGPALKMLNTIHDRLESPASRMLRQVEPWSSYLVLPIFALANAGVLISSDAWTGHAVLMTTILAGLVLGKPVGLLSGAQAAVALGFARKPTEFTITQMAGACALGGIGFTMSLFIAAQAFPTPDDYDAAKIAVFAASAAAAAIGLLLLVVGRARAPSGKMTPGRSARSYARPTAAAVV